MMPTRPIQGYDETPEDFEERLKRYEEALEDYYSELD